MDKAGTNSEQAQDETTPVRRVLVVEDEEGLNNLAQKALRRAGFETKGALTGTEALKQIKTDSSLTMLLDQKLPDMTGVDLIRTLIEQDRRPVFVVMTGQGDERTAVEMMKLGAYDYLVKGFDLTDLLPEVFNRVYQDLETKRRLADAEEKLRRREETYSRLFNNSNDAIFVHSLTGRKPGIFTEVNDVACARLGYSREELLKLTPGDIDADGMNEVKRQAGEAIAETGQAVFEMVHLSKTGQKIPVEISSRVFESEGQHYILSIARDISERKQAEEALRESERRYRTILETAPILFIIHQQGIIQYINKAGCAILGGEHPSVLRGRSVFDFVQPEFKEVVTERYARLKAGKSNPPADIGVIGLDGNELFVESTSLPFTYQNQPAVLLMSIDITERKRAQEEKAQLEEQIHQAQKLESIGLLAGGVAHDFNNILTAIMGHTELAQAQVDPTLPIFADLEEIRKAAERSADLTRQLLAFARKQTIAPQVLDLNETVEGMLKMLRRLIGENIELFWKPATSLWSIRMDPSQVDQILANLCINARDAIPKTGQIIIETENVTIDDLYSASRVEFEPGQYVALTISDNGSGMDKEILNNIFEPFFTTKPMEQGTGLGLATVYGIIKQNKGFINVYSEPDQGTSFNIYLPRYGFQAKQKEEVQQSRGDLTAEGHETILLVEDEPEILHVGRLMLESFGYRVLTAPTPAKAIHQAKEQAGQINLLITDVIMPQMNGRDLAEYLTSLYPGLKHLFMSGYTANVIAHHGVLDQGIKFIQKPFSMQDLAAKVREALDGA